MLVILVLIPGCLRAPQQGEPGGAAPAVVTIWHTLQGAEADALQAQVQGIMKAQPGVIVRLHYVPEQNFVAQTYQAEAGGEGPHLFLAPREILWQLYAKGAISPVVQYNSDAFPALTSQFRFADKLYAQPLLTDLPLFYYRTDSGFAPANLTDLFSKGQLFLGSLNMQSLSSWWGAQGGKLWAAGAPQLNSAENQAFLQQLLTWRDAKQIQLNPDALNQFAGGQASFTIAWASQSALLTQLKVPWVTILPNDLVGGQGQPLVGPTMGIANSSVKTAGAMVQSIRLVEEELLKPALEENLAQAGHRFPASAGYYSLPEGKQGIDVQVAQYLSKAWALAGDSPEWRFIPLVDNAWANAFSGALSPVDALNSAQSEAIKAMAAGSR